MFGYGIAGVALMAFALVHFIKYRSGNWLWLYVIIFLGPLGALIYLVVEVLPELRGARTSSKWLGQRRDIKRLEAMVLDNPSAGNYEELGDLYLEKRDYARARESFSKAITARTDTPHAFYGRAVSALQLGDNAAAIPDLERVVGMDPKYDYNRAAGLLANAYSLAGRSDDAARLFHQALATSTLSETQYYYARFLAQQGRIEEAREMVQQIIRKRTTVSPQLRRADRPWFSAADELLKELNSPAASRR